jgi:autotransporter-associated beta strand protein
VAGANTLYIHTVNSFTMAAGQFTGTRTDGDGALHKSGAGPFFLRGATLAGRVVVAQGPLRLVEDLSTGPGDLVLEGGAILQSSNTTARTVGKPVVITGDMGLGASGSFTGHLYLTNSVDLNGGTPIITNLSPVTVSGVLQNGGFTKMGAATMTVSAVNTYLGPTAIGAGVLVVNGTSADSTHTVHVQRHAARHGHGRSADLVSAPWIRAPPPTRPASCPPVPSPCRTAASCAWTCPRPPGPPARTGTAGFRRHDCRPAGRHPFHHPTGRRRRQLQPRASTRAGRSWTAWRCSGF